MTKEVQSSIVGYRLQNIYNLLGNDRIFSLKFSKPDSKKSLIIDYGYKFYLTQYDRPTEPQPSNFVTKLRKHIKSKRLTNFKQIDKDRIVVLEFSNGRFYLVLEFFSAGNLILLDQELTILALLRVVNDNRVKEKYTAFDPSILFADSIKYYNDDENDESAAATEMKPETTNVTTFFRKVYTSDNIEKWLENAIFVDKKNNKKILSILKLLFLNCSYLSNELIQKELILAGINPSQSSLSLKEDIQLRDLVIQCLNNCEDKLDGIFENSAGYLLLKKNPLYNPEKEKDQLENVQNALIKEEELTTEYKYENFSPFEPVLTKDKDLYKIIKVNGYNSALDKFFSDVEILKNKLRLQHSQTVLDTKLNAVKNENIAKISKLEALETTNYQKGELIILHSDLVDQCISIVTEKLKSGMSWDNINTVIRKEQENLLKRGITHGSVLNTIVLPLDLKENKMTVQLPETVEEEEEEEICEEDYDNHNEPEQRLQEPNLAAEENDISNSESDNDSLADLSDLDDSEEEEESIQKQKNNKKNKEKIKSFSAPVDVHEKPKKFVKVVIELGMSAHANSKTYFNLKKTATIKKIKTEQTANMALKNSTKKINATLKKQIEQLNKDLVIKKQRRKYWFEKFHWFVSSEGYLIIAAKDILQLEMIYYKYFNSKYDYYVHSDIECALHVFVKNNFKNREIPPSTLNQAAMFSLSSLKAWNNKLVTAAWYSEGSKVSKKDTTGTLLPDGMLEVEEKRFLPPMPLNFGVGFIWCLKQENEETETEISDESSEYIDELTDVKDVQVERMNKLDESMKLMELNEVGVTKKESEKIENEGDIENEKTAEKDFKESSKGKKRDTKKDAVASQQTKSSSRSKKAKQKKLNQYVDQDEEDRELRLQALGVLKQQQQVKKEKKQEEENSKHEAQKKRGGNDKSENIRQKKNYSEQFMDILSEGDSNNYCGKINFKRDISKELCMTACDNRELELLDDLIPTFAPWLSLQKYKYKVKIQPGNGKAGKLMNEITHYFMNRKVNGKNNDNIDFDLDFETEHAIINSLKTVDLLPDFTVKGMRVVLPAGSSKNNGGGNGKGGKSTKKKK